MLDKSYHFLQVQSLMLRAEQKCPVEPTPLTEAERILRAKLMYEETMEKIEALGVGVYFKASMRDDRRLSDSAQPLTYQSEDRLDFVAERPMSIIDVIDGCLDCRVIATGTLVALGVPDALLQAEVDENNLQKFGPGGYRREDGKWMKPPGHKPPRIQELLRGMFPNNEHI